MGQDLAKQMDQSTVMLFSWQPGTGKPTGGFTSSDRPLDSQGSIHVWNTDQASGGFGIAYIYIY